MTIGSRDSKVSLNVNLQSLKTYQFLLYGAKNTMVLWKILQNGHFEAKGTKIVQIDIDDLKFYYLENSGTSKL